MSRRPWTNPVTLARVYHDAGTASAAAARLGCSERTVRQYLKEFGIEARRGRPPSETTTDPPRHQLEDDEGYEIVEAWVRDPETGERKRKAVQIHRLVAVAEWGFDAVVGMEVHHRDGHTQHNATRNLVPMSASRHNKMSGRFRWKQPWVGDYTRGEPGP